MNNMEITLKRNYGYELIFEADNVKVVEDIEEREYYKKDDGKSDFSIAPKRDVKTEAIEQFVSVLQDMVYFRVADFDSSALIETLFEKLPQDIAENMATKLNNDYAPSHLP